MNFQNIRSSFVYLRSHFILDPGEYFDTLIKELESFRFNQGTEALFMQTKNWHSFSNVPSLTPQHPFNTNTSLYLIINNGVKGLILNTAARIIFMLYLLEVMKKGLSTSMRDVRVWNHTVFVYKLVVAQLYSYTLS